MSWTGLAFYLRGHKGRSMAGTLFWYAGDPCHTLYQTGNLQQAGTAQHFPVVVT